MATDNIELIDMHETDLTHETNLYEVDLPQTKFYSDKCIFFFTDGKFYDNNGHKLIIYANLKSLLQVLNNKFAILQVLKKYFSGVKVIIDKDDENYFLKEHRKLLGGGLCSSKKLTKAEKEIYYLEKMTQENQQIKCIKEEEKINEKLAVLLHKQQEYNKQIAKKMSIVVAGRLLYLNNEMINYQEQIKSLDGKEKQLLEKKIFKQQQSIKRQELLLKECEDNTKLIGENVDQGDRNIKVVLDEMKRILVELRENNKNYQELIKPLVGEEKQQLEQKILKNKGLIKRLETTLTIYEDNI